MDKRQKSTLRRYQIKLAEELILDEDFYAALRQNKLFTEAMVATIRAESTDKDRIYKMIKLLPKRGPQAFNHFVAILRENFGWVADMLEKGHAEICSLSIPVSTDSTDEEQPDGRPNQFYYSQRTMSSEWPIEPVRTHRRQYQSQYSLPCSTLNYTEGTYINRNSHTYSFQQDSNTDTGDTHIQGRNRNCKDACNSPIQIIESPRKFPVTHEKRITIHEERETVRSTYSIRQSFTEADYMSNDDEEDYVDKDADGCPNKTLKQRTGLDEPDIGKVNIQTDDDDWVSASDSEEDTNGLDTETLNTQKINMDSREQIEKMKANKSLEKQNKILKVMFEKLQGFVINAGEIMFQNPTVQNRQTMHEENESLLEKINLMIGEVIDKDSDDAVTMIDKCYTYVTSKDRKLPLDACIKNLNEEIKSLKEALDEEVKKANKMADDMYKHQQEMKKLNNMKKLQSQLQADNAALQDKCRELAHSKEEKDKEVRNLTQQIMHMETLLHEKENDLSEYKKSTDKRIVRRIGTAATRKMPLATVTRRPGMYPSNESRLMAAKGTNPNRTPRGSLTSSMNKFKRP